MVFFFRRLWWAALLPVFIGGGLLAWPWLQDTAKAWEGASVNQYDVVVLGGEPEGIAAAVTAARNGARTLLIEQRDGLGGLITYGMLNSLDMNRGPDGELVTRGIFEEFFRAVGGDSVDVGQARQVFSRMVRQEPKLFLMLNTSLAEPVLSEDSRTLQGIRVSKDGKIRTIMARRLIDATQDADLAALGGVPFTLGGEDRGLNAFMASTLVLHLGGVNWEEVVKAVRMDGNPDTGSTETSAWGLIEEMKGYQPTTPRIRVRAPNLGRQRDGSVLINAMLIFGVDGLSPASKAEAMNIGRQEAPYLLNFMREKLPGFQNARLMGTAPELYVRETRHMIGEYQLTVNDVLENRDFPDRIAIGSYPVDIQATGPDNYGWAIGRPVMYSIPFRSLIPLRVENLMVVGRSASFTSLAAGSARVIPIGMAAGQAAGTAAAYSLEAGLSPRKLSQSPGQLGEVQKRLIDQGAFLQPFDVGFPLKTHWVNPAVRVLRPLGLISAGYNNDYYLDQPVSPRSFMNLTWQAFKRRGYVGLPDRSGLEKQLSGESITTHQALAVLEAVLGRGRGDSSWLGEIARAHFDDHPYLTRGLAYVMVAEALIIYQLLYRSCSNET